MIDYSKFEKSLKHLEMQLQNYKNAANRPELSEIDRAFLWASGLLSIIDFAEELNSWNRDISYPSKRTK